ncbi:MAG: hypothetical protein ABIW38_05205 [Ferruginibacter sp.]
MNTLENISGLTTEQIIISRQQHGSNANEEKEGRMLGQAESQNKHP